jgi:hypothetical protein
MDQVSGDLPRLTQLAAFEICSGRVLYLEEIDLCGMLSPPYGCDTNTLVVCFGAVDVAAAHLEQGWGFPRNLIDLGLESLREVNGIVESRQWSLNQALCQFGLSRAFALENGECFVSAESSDRDEARRACKGRLRAMQRLLEAIAPLLDIPRALLRGRFLLGVAMVERNGVPIDVEQIMLLRKLWPEVEPRLIRDVDIAYGVYEGTCFDIAAFRARTEEWGLDWPRIYSGGLDLSDRIFRDMAAVYPFLRPLRELRAVTTAMDREGIGVGTDGRNRAPMKPYGTRTGRNAPSPKQFVLAGPRALRRLIRPEPGHGLAYVDYVAQDVGVAAALSRDPRLIEDYKSMDAYMAAAIRLGSAPLGASRHTHPEIRNRFKLIVISILYGIGAPGLASRLGVTCDEARNLMDRHRALYPGIWHFLDGAVTHARKHGFLSTVLGWRVDTSHRANPDSRKSTFQRNFLVQGTSAEITHLACCKALDQGIRVIATVHDALMIEAPLSELDEAVVTTQEVMASASRDVLSILSLFTSVDVTPYPERYMGRSNSEIWDRIWKIMKELRERPGK